MKLVLVSLMFTWDQVDPVWIRSALWYQIGPLMKVIPCGPKLFKYEPALCKTDYIHTTVDLIPNRSERMNL